MAVLFTSDLHLGHRKVAEIRGFSSVEEHDATIADMWANTVRKDDEVWVLGDVTANASRAALDPALALLASLPGRMHLIAGNHDGLHPMHRDAHKHVRRYLEVFDSVASSARRRIAGREVLLSHFPYERDRHESRHMQWRLRDEGLPLLHGHTHGTERLTRTTRVEQTNAGTWEETWDLEPYLYGREFTVAPIRTEVHVGLDAWGLQLVPLETVDGLLTEALG